MKSRSAKSLSLEQQINSGTLQTNTAIVLDHVRNNRNCNVHSMRKELKFMTHQTLTSRISDLEDEGWIYASGQIKVHCDDGKDRTYTTYRYEPNSTERYKRSRQRAYDKYVRLRDRILTDFHDFYKNDNTWPKHEN